MAYFLFLTASFFVRQISAVVLKITQFRFVHAFAIGASELGVMITLSNVVHHTANAQIIFVGTISAIVHTVTTLVHRNTVFVFARKSIVERATHVGCKN